MTGEEKKRATLHFGDELETPATLPVDPNAIKAATRAAGFCETPKASDFALTAPTKPTRRRKTGHTKQFATRLRADTIDAIYAYADRHEITLAETIEGAISALIGGERLWQALQSIINRIHCR
ncbi:stability/partitioning determinant [Devosia neptuniae]|uniref:stability/partitioning determinant n=1 Tax=Devosia neptuniae TaxID=191302 RepID=UPI0022AFEA93|nr:stability/partitioning determinant [Devosia neptuniae]MCZ4348169.1 stability/partitioning determinant [Devosia neptuniae]